MPTILLNYFYPSHGLFGKIQIVQREIVSFDPQGKPTCYWSHMLQGDYPSMEAAQIAADILNKFELTKDAVTV
jgi:hypothetical protein